MSLVPLLLLSLTVDKLHPISWGTLETQSFFTMVCATLHLYSSPPQWFSALATHKNLPGELKNKTKNHNCLDASPEQLNQKFKKGYQL